MPLPAVRRPPERPGAAPAVAAAGPVGAESALHAAAWRRSAWIPETATAAWRSAGMAGTAPPRIPGALPWHDPGCVAIFGGSMARCESEDSSPVGSLSTSGPLLWRSSARALVTAWCLLLYTNLVPMALGVSLPGPQAPESGCRCLTAGAMEGQCCCAVPEGACALPVDSRTLPVDSRTLPVQSCAGAGLPALAAAPCGASGSSAALPADGGCRFPHLPVHLGFAGAPAAVADPFAACDPSPQAPFRDPPDKIPI